MNRFLLFIGLLPTTGCLSSAEQQGGPDPQLVSVEELALRLRVDYVKVRKGQSVLYSVTAPDRTYLYKVSAAEEIGTDLWIEEKMPAAPPAYPRPWIRKTLLDRTGEAREIWFGDPAASQPVRWWPPAGGKEEVRIRPRPDLKARILDTRPDEPQLVQGNVYTCTRVTSTLTPADGSTVLLIDWCSPEVPFPVVHPDGQSHGGIVRRVLESPGGARYVLELASMGTQARPELHLPR